MAIFDKKEFAEACDGFTNAVVNQLCNKNLPKNPEDWARLFEKQAEKAIEECGKIAPFAFAKTLKKETEALEKMLTNSKQNREIMEENTTVFVVMTCDDPEAAFSSEELADMFISTHERDYHTYIQPLELDKADKYFDPEQYMIRKEDFDETQKAVLRKIHDEEKSAENTRQETSKVPLITSYGECTHPNRKCECRKEGKCPDAQMAIQFCRNCSDEDLQKADEFAKALPHALKQIAEEKERVNHPKHYQHPSGVECITVARHHDFNIGNALKYLFRAGLKQEQGISPLDKQIEDLQKAVFYIQDEIQFLKTKQQEQ